MGGKPRQNTVNKMAKTCITDENSDVNGWNYWLQLLGAMSRKRSILSLMKASGSQPNKNGPKYYFEFCGTVMKCLYTVKEFRVRPSLLLVVITLFNVMIGSVDSVRCTGREDFIPTWEPLLWGGKVAETPFPDVIEQVLKLTEFHRRPSDIPGAEKNPSRSQPTTGSKTVVTSGHLESPIIGPSFMAPPLPSVISRSVADHAGVYYSAPLRMLTLKNIPPLYVNPELPGEGVWEWRGLPTDSNGRPLMYRTSYRPSEKYPNAIVHMLLLDMKKLSMKLYVGSSEPGAGAGVSMVEPENRKHLVAVTNALWKQKHSGEAGTVVSGSVVKELQPGLATLVIFRDGSVDILEWGQSIADSQVRDAKQLRHLIVKDGSVVNGIVVGGKQTDSEIGLGYLLSESEPMPMYQYWNNWWGPPSETTYGPDWFIATRSAFGIRKDGNLIFAIGHHISTKDLAKALVLAGCDRAIHGDANPHNVLGNLYFSDGNGNFLKKEKLSPEQKTYTLERYVDKTYTSDFFAFFSEPSS